MAHPAGPAGDQQGGSLMGRLGRWQAQALGASQAAQPTPPPALSGIRG